MSGISVEVKSRSNIVDVIGEYVPLKKQGTIYKGLCPFHEEKTPSFAVNESKQIYHCFGCGAGGDVFEFLMKHLSIDFPEALRIQSVKVGLEPSKEDGKNGRLYDMNSEAERFFRENLQKSPAALAYFKKERGLTDESIERFHLGSTNGVQLHRLLRQKGYTEEEIIQGGLAHKGARGVLDVFFNRVMFPIIVQGRVKAFGGRIVSDGDPKYLNSPVTDVFKKSQTVYGFDSVAIKSKGYALISEGYLDIIIAHQHGYRNTVAPLGTSLSEDQIMFLRTYTNTFYLVFDADAAGERAALKASELMFGRQCRGGVVMLPPGEDLDSFFRGGGDLESFIKKALPFSVFISQKKPQLRAGIFEALLFRSPLDVAQYQAYLSTPEERLMAAEMAAGEAIRKLFEKSAVVAKHGTAEVMMARGQLALFDAGLFKLCVEAKGNYKKHADKMIEDFLRLESIYAEMNGSPESTAISERA